MNVHSSRLVIANAVELFSSMPIYIASYLHCLRLTKVLQVLAYGVLSLLND